MGWHTWMLLLAVAAPVAAFRGQDGKIETYSHVEHMKDASAGQDLRISVGKARPRIYVYDLPGLPEYRNWTKWGDLTDTNYGLDQLWIAMLRESPYVTSDPEEADYFTPDVWLFWPGAQPKIKRVIEEIRKQGPWWERKGGADHIFIVAADQGRCEYPAPEALKSIFVMHFGGGLHRMTTHCDISQGWQARCDRELLLADAAAQGKTLPTCFHPFKDIVVPTTAYERHDNAHDHDEFAWGKKVDFAAPKTPYIHSELRGFNRSTTLFFSGHVDIDRGKPFSEAPPWADAGYSFGTRQTVFRMFEHTPGFGVLNTHTHLSYWERLASSVFCLATPGWGWGGRMKVAVNRGCIPLVLSDGIKVEWEEQVDLGQYALRVPLWMVHKLPPLLQWWQEIGRVEPMQQVMERCAWRLHWWRRPYGRAFELLMCELRSRLHPGGVRMKVDLQACTMTCGDDTVVDLRKGWNNVS